MKLKEAIISELTNLSYKERQMFKGDIDKEFISEEFIKMKKYKNKVMIFGVSTIILTLFYMILLIFTLKTEPGQVFIQIMSGVFYLFYSLAFIWSLGELKRRKSIFRILIAYAEDKNN
ncbi:hypothetical protein ACFLSI_01170 [Bacteroidota bacterium]